jgi:hypothetical protein
MTFELNAALSLSVGVGAVISWIRLPKADPAYFPFCILLSAGFVTEIISILLMIRGQKNILLYNCFSLAEALLISWQFNKWRLMGNKRVFYFSLQSLYLISWTIEMVWRDGFHHFTSFFIIGYSTVIVFIAIAIINGVIFKESLPLFLNSIFIICMGLIVYFTYMVLIEIFWVYGLNKSSKFRIRVYDIFAFINLFTNLLFAFATLWIPMKRQYILRSS